MGLNIRLRSPLATLIGVGEGIPEKGQLRPDEPRLHPDGLPGGEGTGRQPMRPCSRATATASPRVAAPSLARMLETCTLAVLREMKRASAI